MAAEDITPVAVANEGVPPVAVANEGIPPVAVVSEDITPVTEAGFADAVFTVVFIIIVFACVEFMSVIALVKMVVCVLIEEIPDDPLTFVVTFTAVTVVDGANITKKNSSVDLIGNRIL